MFIVFIFSGCSSVATSNSDSDDDCRYTHVHFFDKIEGYCATVTKESIGSIGVAVETKEFGSMYLPHGTYQYFEDVCPYCS